MAHKFYAHSVEGKPRSEWQDTVLGCPCILRREMGNIERNFCAVRRGVGEEVPEERRY